MLAVSASCFAQSEEALLEQLNNPFLPSLNNDILIQQEGMYHQAVVQQTNAQHSQLRIEQLGTGHTLEAVQQGRDNRWDIQQNGEDHRYSGSLTGNHNQVQVRQSGQQNSIRQDLSGNGLDYTIIQQGQNLELTQIEYDGLAPAYQVEQRGEGMKITIEQGLVGITPQQP